MFLCGCNSSASPNSSSDTIVKKAKVDDSSSLQIKNIMDLNDEEFSNVISFNNNCTFVAVNTNKGFDMNHTVSIYGKFLISDDAKLLKDKIGEKIIKVSLYDEKVLLIGSDNLSWEFTDTNNGVDFVLSVPMEDDFCLSDTVKISKIVFYTPKASFVKNIEAYYLMPYYDKNNKVRIIESPMTPTDSIEKDSKSAYSYLVMTVNPKFNSKYNVDVQIPEDCKKYVDVDSISIKEDIRMEKDLQTTLNTDLTLQQKKDLRVYDINVVYHFISGDRVVLQPLIKINITGEEQIIAPFCTLDLHEK
jgi:phage antirepressor YoqD-like protein